MNLAKAVPPPILPSIGELEHSFQVKHAKTGWGPRLRARFGYFTPDDVYETTVAKLVTTETEWLDVGGGRDLFPSNETLAKTLSRKACLLVGVDPSENILENRFVHRQARSTIEEFHAASRFDLITLRMVAEHLTDPRAAADALARLTKPGGHLVILTVNKWSAITALSWLTPVKVHHWIKKWLWESEERDTFEVVYRMNTRTALRKLLEYHGFREVGFAYPADCRIFARWRITNAIELCAWKLTRWLHVPYPETCLLGIYRKLPG
jgi:2-polyprenyl-3-methyl-5-hydroxy-6-metoxy-1,4-benzoquinol methylase